MANIIIALVFALLVAGCDRTPQIDWTTTQVDRASYAYEDGLRAGHADAKSTGVCDHPFPREQSYPGYGSLYLTRFETGYYKGCAIARKSSSGSTRKKTTLFRPSEPDRCKL